MITLYAWFPKRIIGKYEQILRTENEVYFEYIDKWNRKWKLTPVTNENIIAPFIVTPLPHEEK